MAENWKSCPVSDRAMTKERVSKLKIFLDRENAEIIPHACVTRVLLVEKCTHFVYRHIHTCLENTLKIEDPTTFKTPLLTQSPLHFVRHSAQQLSWPNYQSCHSNCLQSPNQLSLGPVCPSVPRLSGRSAPITFLRMGFSLS